MAELIQQQKLDVEFDFYGFALQDLDDAQVPQRIRKAARPAVRS
ncbi:hypothetical protein [Streptomyces olivochromogenes]|uniref:Uncharacterized protein n=1 Tax=Streptomyces olivochromogenes TaxID=1963 RepID=A0A250VUC6_STROL|nr:hypothetical protein [Streptomyces olivochromogenes]GAX57858.1 hypothetical protein SO3561_09428 [Streptomyces olivochromogenes]